MRVLFIEEQLEQGQAYEDFLKARPTAVVERITSLQGGIEALENPASAVELVVCDYHGKGTVLLKCILSLCTNVPCILIVDNGDEAFRVSDIFKVEHQLVVEICDRKAGVEGLSKRYNNLLKRGFFKQTLTPDAEYFRIPTKTLMLSGSMPCDIYVRLGANRYLKLFKIGDRFDAVDLERYFKKKGIEYFYIPQEQAGAFMSHQTNDLVKLEAPGAAPDEQRKAAESALEFVHACSEKLGFTPEIQAIATKSVMLTLKVIGNKPGLAPIIARLKNQEGNYIASHSMMLAEICCAVAARVGWRSAPTYLKLALASFLHDLSLHDNRLARFRMMEEVRADLGFEAQMISDFRFHPVKAAEYSRQFHDIPPDVDTILIQHHERPDGTGFPRGLFHNQLSPLSCVFIVGHDLLHYFLAEGGEPSIERFVAAHGQDYPSGTFKKIIKALISGPAPGA